MTINDLRPQIGKFGKIKGRNKLGDPIETYGHIEAVNCKSIWFSDIEEIITLRLYDIEYFEEMEKPK